MISFVFFAYVFALLILIFEAAVFIIQVILSFVVSGFSSFEIWNKITSAQAATSIGIFHCKKHSIGGFLLAVISLLALS